MLQRSLRHVGVLLALVLLLAACGQPPVQRQESYVFGTRVEVLVASRDAAAAREAIAAVLREFDRLHRTYHAWQPSELTAVNDAIAAGRPVKVTPELAQLITEATAVAARGDGLFDPGIGGLVRLWGFQADEFRPRLPDAAALAAWRAARPGIADLQLDGLTLRSRKRQVALDFGGYLKGVALDRARDILHARGIKDALINIGGNVMALGTKFGEPWRVGIQDPRRPGPLATLALADGEAIGTSGDYQRFFELDGHRYCHLLDPRSAEPVTHTEAVTVLVTPAAAARHFSAAAAGMLSDAASKPIFIAGPEGWRREAAQLGVDAALRVDAAGHVQVTRALAARLKFEAGVPAPEIVD